MLCAIYCRLSKEDEDKQQPESESIQNQKSMLVKYAVERGWEIYNIYSDEDRSGVDAERPDFCRMLADAEAGRFQLVLCKTQSRFTRDMELVERYIHGKFPLWGVRFVSIADNTDTDVKGNKKARQINGLINEWYLEDLSENIRMVLDHKRRQGQYIGGFPIYGYQKDPDDKNKLVIDPDAAPVVRQIYQWYLEGHGAQHIAYLLNERGISNPTKHKREKGMTYINGSAVDERGLWNKLTISRILRNEMYAGVMVQGRRKKVSYKSKAQIDVPQEQWFRVEGTHEPIIEPETFHRVQELIRPRVKIDGGGEAHVLSGLVKCADCGSTMSKTSNGQTGEKRASYLRCKLSIACSSRALCTRHSIRLDVLIELVSERLRAHINEYYELGDISRFEGKSWVKDDAAMLQKELRSLEAQAEKRSAALKALYLDKVSGVIDEAQFEEMNRDFLHEKDVLLHRRQALQSELDDLGEKDGCKAELTSRIAELMRFDPMPRELFVLAIERIEIGERDKETSRQAVRIIWKF